MANKNTIPPEVIRYQNEQGFNHSEYIATIGDEDVYSISLIDDDGFCIPTRLPTLILVSENGWCRRSRRNS